MKPLLLTTLLALLAISAEARVGETIKQVEARYGKPQKIFIDRTDLRKVGYGYRGFMVIVYFSGGVSKRESFGLPGGRKISRQAASELLRLSTAPGTSWKEGHGDHGDILWISNQKRVVAALSQDADAFIVQDLRFNSRE